ncbi:NAD kinase 2, mitochondrial-like [Polistes fuscatus]|uniref:NAD kinase 2, mitochondrial-like n=1 Tax=Polistes fuscatus TaxID=30207 RepID=UPI001CA8FD05|nr:NAD kinase 2, mitochondrial-like [Polistes fuscatus]
MKLTRRLLCLPFRPKRVLGITKVTLWDVIRSKFPDLDEMRLHDKFISLQPGISPDILKQEHEMTIDCENQLNEIMKKIGCNFRMVKRVDNANDDVEWADLVISIGGDGAFLLASRLIQNNKKAIIGINPITIIDEQRTFSIHRCTEIENIFEKLQEGRYNLLMRSRIRTTMYGKDINHEPYQLNEKTRSVKDLTKDIDDGKNSEIFVKSNETKIADFLQESHQRVLPWLALNEVYMGEFLSTGTITLTIQVDDQDVYKIQCSGICVCTGSGSRSWFRSMNLQAPETVKRLIKIAMGKDIDEDDAMKVIQSYHRSLSFDPEDERMSYMVRELYRARKWPKPKSSPERRMCRKVKVISHGFHAGLVIDGGVTLPFNDGTTAVFEIHSEDDLKNLIIR